MSKTVVLWFGLFLLCASAGFAQEAQYFEEEQKPHLLFQWDLFARYDRFSHLVFRPDIVRGRFEVRPELDLVLSDRFRLGARAVADLGTDQNSDNAKNFDNYRSNGATLDRYFIEGKPGAFELRAGSFGMPLLSTEMLWDNDIQVLGAAAAWETPAGASRITLAAGGFVGPQREGDRTRVGAGQIVWRLGDRAAFSMEAATSYWFFDPDSLKPSYFRQNYSEPDGRGGLELGSRFRIVDALVRFHFPVGRVPVTISLDGLVNLGTRGETRRERQAFEGSIVLGQVGTPGNVRGFYTFQYIARDAVAGAYNTDDWWFHSWCRGHRLGLAVTVFPQIFVQGTLMIQQRLDRDTHLNRITIDLVKMY